MKVVIGLIGEIGAGKETFAQLLDSAATDSLNTRYRVRHLSTSHILRQILRLLDLEEDRDNLQKLPVTLEKAFGVGTIAHAMSPLISKSEADIVIYDSVRWVADLETVREFPHRLVYITADQTLRWRRTCERKEKAHEDLVTLADFRRSEQKMTERMIPRLAENAQFRIENNGEWSKFREEVYRLFRNGILPAL